MKSINSLLKVGDIIAVRGNSWISKIIQLATFSKYSHIGVIYKIENGIPYIAEIDINYPFKVHLLTHAVYDIYRLDGYVDEEKLRQSCDKLLGKDYDVGDIVRLLCNIQTHTPNKLICSEAVNEIFKSFGVTLSRKKIPTPKDILKSKHIRKLDVG